MGRVLATIAANESLSEEVIIAGRPIRAFRLPSGLVGTVLTFQIKDNPTDTLVNGYDDENNEISIKIPAAPSRLSVDSWAYALDNIYSLKVRTGTASAPTTQTGEKTIVLIVQD
jgi:hypothetical protein